MKVSMIKICRCSCWTLYANYRKLIHSSTSSVRIQVNDQNLLLGLGTLPQTLENWSSIVQVQCTLFPCRIFTRLSRLGKKKLKPNSLSPSRSSQQVIKTEEFQSTIADPSSVTPKFRFQIGTDNFVTIEEYRWTIFRTNSLIVNFEQ